MNSYLTKLIKSIKSCGMERNESNQIKSNKIKSNQSQEKTYTTWVWLLWKSHEINSILFINNTLFWFRLNILLNESSRLTFWNRFGISNYHPYSLFRSTYNVTKTRITETPSFRITNGCSIWKIHIQSFRSISIITSHCQRTGIIITPSFSPTLQYPISQTTHFFLLIPLIISFNHS